MMSYDLLTYVLKLNDVREDLNKIYMAQRKITIFIPQNLKRFDHRHPYVKIINGQIIYDEGIQFIDVK